MKRLILLIVLLMLTGCGVESSAQNTVPVTTGDSQVQEVTNEYLESVWSGTMYSETGSEVVQMMIDFRGDGVLDYYTPSPDGVCLTEAELPMWSTIDGMLKLDDPVNSQYYNVQIINVDKFVINCQHKNSVITFHRQQ